MASGNVSVVRIYRGEDKIGEVALEGERMTIGRSNKVDITLESNAISRRHAELIRKPDGNWWINDLFSGAGTFINGKAEMEHQLEMGDRVIIDDFTLLFGH
ncbi:MAG: FHA domain-containing protein [Myxococcales bacterium]|nr:FHA domain-containing protein [Myxococcales bacterium]